MDQFERVSRQYGAFVGMDPFRNCLHYPAVMSELGDVRGRTILDIGCGDGRLARKFASEGATVYGYDSAPGQISEAVALGTEGIRYSIATPQSFQCDELFDDAVSVLVLPYAESESALTPFFASAFSLLRKNGRFISIIFNPSFSAFGESLGCRAFQRETEGRVTVQFLSPETGHVEFTSTLTQFPTATYEAAALAAGFTRPRWSKLFPTLEGRVLFGDEFWSRCIDVQPYSVFIVDKLE